MALNDFLSAYQNSELRTVVIPGSHDAGLSADYAEKLSILGSKGSSVITQSEGAGQQAVKGSRFFDVRVMDVGGELKSFHSAPMKKVGYKSDSRRLGASGQGFLSILDELRDFVKGNPSEFVIVRLSHLMDSRKVFQHLAGWIQQNRNHVYRGTGNLAVKTVGELAGKLVIIIEARKLKSKNFIDFGDGRGVREPLQTDGFHSFHQSKEGVLPSVDDGLCVCGQFSNSKKLEDIIRKQVANYSRHDQHRNYQGAQAHLYSVYWTATWGNIQENTRQLDAPNFRRVMEQMGLDSDPDTTPRSGLANAKEWFDYIATANDARRAYSIKSVSIPNVILYDFINDTISREIVKLNDLITVEQV